MNSPSTPPLASRLVNYFAQYFLNRCKKFAVYAALILVMYVAQRRGYFRKFLAFAWTKAEKRIMQKIEDEQKSAARAMSRGEEFSTGLKQFTERFPAKCMNFIKWEVDKHYNMEELKNNLKLKDLTAAEKTVNWQNFRAAVCSSSVYVVVLKSYLWSVWLIREILQSKSKQLLEDIIKPLKKTKDTKFLSDCIGSTQEFINKFLDSLISFTAQEIYKKVNKVSGLLEWKLNDKVSIDSFIAKLEEIKNILLTSDMVVHAIPETIDLSFKALGSGKGTIHFKLVHKVLTNLTFSISSIFKTLYRHLLAPHPTKLEPEINSTVISRVAFSRYKDYSVDVGEYRLMSYLLAEARRKSTERLSIIAEMDENDEDKSGVITDLEEQAAKSQLIYEESSTFDGKDYDKQQTIIKELEKFSNQFFREFMDYLTCENTQLLTESLIEYNFKKLATRLILFKNINTQNSGDLVYMKLLTVVNKVVEEEITDKIANKNDLILYEARTKDLFLQVKNEKIENPLLTEVNIMVAEESKLHTLVKRASREYAARIFFDEEFEKFYGDEFDRPRSDKRSPAKAQADGLEEFMNIMNKVEAGRPAESAQGSILPF